MTMYKFNMNDEVKVRLTETGIKELKRQHDELQATVPVIGDFKEPSKDEKGYSTYQAWVLFSSLGHLMTMGGDLPFQTDILIEIK